MLETVLSFKPKSSTHIKKKNKPKIHIIVKSTNSSLFSESKTRIDQMNWSTGLSLLVFEEFPKFQIGNLL